LADKRHLIVGIDPGTTTGIALLGLDGKVCGLYSSRTFTLKDVIHLIIGNGYPLIVATDVFPVPEFVDKVCRLFEAVLHQPTHSLTVEEKREIANSFAERFSTELFFRNSHEKDAFAAAAKALESYGEKFRWIDRKLNEMGLAEVSERVKTMVVMGRSLSDSVKEILEERKRPRPRKAEAGPAQAVKAQPVESKLRISHRIESSMIRNMQGEILELNTKLKERELKIESLRNELERAHSGMLRDIVRSSEINSRNQMIIELKRSLSRVAADRDRMRQKLEALSGSRLWGAAGRIEAISILADLSKETVGRANGQHAPGSRFILVRDPSGTGVSVPKVLSDMKVEAIITEGEMPGPARQCLESLGIPVIPRRKVEIIVVGDTALADKEGMDRILSAERKRLAKAAVGKAMSGLERLVDGYRKELGSERPR